MTTKTTRRTKTSSTKNGRTRNVRTKNSRTRASGGAGVLRGVLGMPREVRRRRNRTRRWLRSLQRLMASLGQELRGARAPEAGVRIGPKGAALVGPPGSGRRAGSKRGGGGFAQFQQSRPDLFPGIDPYGIDPDYWPDDTGWDAPDDGHDGPDGCGEVAG